MASCPSSVVKTGKPYRCTRSGCEKSYTKPSRLTEHERSHTGERPFVCATCGKSYLRETHLQAHSRSHLPQSARPLLCSETNCEKRFWTTQHLRAHEALHKGVKPFGCSEAECSEAFTKHHQLRAHICGSHTPAGTKPYRCDHVGCTKSFSTSQHFRNHSRVHDDKRYTCIRQECLPTGDEPPAYYSTWTALQHHIRVAHPPTCPHLSCSGKTFSSRKGLRAHEKIHEQRDQGAEIEAAIAVGSDIELDDGPSRRRGGDFGRDWKCEIVNCDRDFKSKKALVIHTNVAHLGRRDHVCPDDKCKRAYGYKHLLQRHLSRCHFSAPSESFDSSDEHPKTITRAQTDKVAAGIDIERITGKTYALQAKQRVEGAKALECPFPHLSELGFTDTIIAGGSECHFVFSRGYDLWRHLRARHQVEVEREGVDEWVRRKRRVFVISFRSQSVTMSDNLDFARLVSLNNPAAALQYQQANSGYPPPSDSAFGRPPPSIPSEQNGHLLGEGALPPAGPGFSKPNSLGEELPTEWVFDDDTFQSASDPPFPGPAPFSRPFRVEENKSLPRRRKWKWPWQREKIVLGDRVVALNNEDANVDFCSNFVSTSKYNAATFLPKFLAEQFSKYANLFFLFTACIQQIPDVSPTNRYTTIVPLALVLAASAFKELQEDLKRRHSDSELNARRTKVLARHSTFADKRWKDIQVGDVIRLESDDFIPADLVLISSSEPEGLCYIETSNLDGETNLKIKQASPQTSSLTSPSLVTALHGSLRSEQPNNSLYTYEGTLDLITSEGLPKQVPLGPDQLLLRGAQIRNTPWVYGLVVFTGHETKLMRNATAAPIKRTAVERQVNLQIVFLFVLLLALSAGSTIGSSIRIWFFSTQQWYLFETSSLSGRAKGFLEDILTFIILYNNLIPISLIVTMEVVKFQQALLINYDLDMYHAKTDTPALCRTSSLVEELGQIDYVFSDKTGTLTRNEMEFRCCSIAGVAYADVVDETKRGEGEDGKDGWKTFSEMRTFLEDGDNPFVNTGPSPHDKEREALKEFLTLLAVCHTVIPEDRDGKIHYQASSPDEAALVAGAELLGYRFHTRNPKSVFVTVQGVTQEFEILKVCEFNSNRKRMSTVVRLQDGQIKLYCKGADTVIVDRVNKNHPYVEKTLLHLEEYATEGLRTLCLAVRDISEAEYRQWATIYDQAAATINGRGEALDQAAELIEKDMFLLGATAVEDKLQDGVPDTIHTLQLAGIKVWVLTGDRQETAINIGMSCRLISESMNLVVVNEDTAHETQEFLRKRLSAIQNQRSAGELEDLALIIDGKSLAFALEKDLSKTFLELAVMCKAVICCRVSPLQKALVVKLVKNTQKAILLAIGDGANDVSMIQAAHVGVGISGVEGLQAARSADVSISQFRFLKKLLLVHGAWSYRRLSKLILYSFYKNIVLYMTQFWFSFFNNFSGQIAYESWTLSLYNVVFTVLPPLVIGVFDQFVSARILDRYPQLYILGQKNAFFTKTAFWLWVGNALYHSLVLFVFSIILFWGDLKQATGFDSGHWFWGTTLYLAVLLTVLGKAALISDLWTKYTLAAIPGSFIFTMFFLPLYAVIAPAIGFSTEYYGIVPRLWTDGIFYFTLIVVPILCLSRDFAWKYYRRTYNPAPYHIAQELQKYNIPDYRPRQEQFQKAIKKVRAVQRMRRNRGFAFSQTENGRQDQTKLIRAYDTSKSNAKPSGY